jgi:hypothetical protein
VDSRAKAAALMADERKRTIQAAYDTLGERFGEWEERFEGMAFLWVLARKPS